MNAAYPKHPYQTAQEFADKNEDCTSVLLPYTHESGELKTLTVLTERGREILQAYHDFMMREVLADVDTRSGEDEGKNTEKKK